MEAVFTSSYEGWWFATPPSHETVDTREHFVYQEGQAVFKVAVSKMADVSVEIMEKNGLSPETLPGWFLIRPI